MIPLFPILLRPRLALVSFVALALITALPSASAQTVFNAVVSGPNGPVHGLFQVQNGAVTAIPTGLSTNQFPALSRNGRFITIAAPDPAQPNQLATDLFIFDRLTNTRERMVNYTVQPQTDGSFVTPHAAFSALSPNNQLVALQTLLIVTTNQPASNSVPMLTVNRASDGFQLSIAEMGQGNALDFFRSEFVGISWAPNGSFFATPAYVNQASRAAQSESSCSDSIPPTDNGNGSTRQTSPAAGSVSTSLAAGHPPEKPELPSKSPTAIPASGHSGRLPLQIHAPRDAESRGGLSPSRRTAFVAPTVSSVTLDAGQPDSLTKYFQTRLQKEFGKSSSTSGVGSLRPEYYFPRFSPLTSRAANRKCPLENA